MAEKFQHLPGAFTQTARIGISACRAMWRHPIRIFANEERNWGNTGWDYSALSLRGFGVRARVGIGSIIDRRGMRRQTAPSHCSGQTKLIKPFGVIVRDTSR